MGLSYKINAIEREDADIYGTPTPKPTSNPPPLPESTPNPVNPPVVGSRGSGFIKHETIHCHGPLCWAATGEIVETMIIPRMVCVRLTGSERSPDADHKVMYSELTALRDRRTVMQGEVGDYVSGFWVDDDGILCRGMGIVTSVYEDHVLAILRCHGWCDWGRV